MLRFPDTTRAFPPCPLVLTAPDTLVLARAVSPPTFPAAQHPSNRPSLTAELTVIPWSYGGNQGGNKAVR